MSTEKTVATARPAAHSLLKPVLETLEDLAAAPVGTVIEDAQGDMWERRQHGAWRGNALPNRLFDEALAVYLPAKVTNHAELAELSLEGYRLGDLAKVMTNDYALAVRSGTNGVVERIHAGHLYLRFKGGMVVPLLPSEVQPVALPGLRVQVGDRVVICEDVYAHQPVGKGAVGYVTSQVAGAIEPSFRVRFEGDSPWFGRVADWEYPESALAVVSRY